MTCFAVIKVCVAERMRLLLWRRFGNLGIKDYDSQRCGTARLVSPKHTNPNALPYNPFPDSNSNFSRNGTHACVNIYTEISIIFQLIATPSQVRSLKFETNYGIQNSASTSKRPNSNRYLEGVPLILGSLAKQSLQRLSVRPEHLYVPLLLLMSFQF